MPDYGTGRCDFPQGNAKDLYDSMLRPTTIGLIIQQRLCYQESLDALLYRYDSCGEHLCDKPGCLYEPQHTIDAHPLHATRENACHSAAWQAQTLSEDLMSVTPPFNIGGRNLA